ncbi:MAG: sugar ABC transporter substrate-binding protein [Spartobacteria bacterium]|nr:sugar ABC transporter substrate-binding protein [Spartobacteria bacterium]
MALVRVCGGACWVTGGSTRKLQSLAAQSDLVDMKMQISNNDVAKQLAQCENLFAQKIDVLILAPNDSEGAAVIVNKAKQYGIPVIAYDRMIMNCDLDMYVSFDNERIGEMQGEYLLERVPQGNYVILAGAPSDSCAHEYRKGAMKILTPSIENGDICVVMDQWIKNWQAAEAMKIVENALTLTRNNVQAVLAPNDGTAGGSIQALAIQGLAGKIPVTGQDAEVAAVRRIIQGTQSMTIYVDTRKLANAAFQAAIDLSDGKVDTFTTTISNKKRDVPALLLTPVVVDKSNLDAVLIDSGYMTHKQAYGTAP